MKRCLFFLMVMMVTLSAHAGMVVIVNANSRIAHLSRDEVVNIFMGRYRRLPDGSSVQPLDIRGEAPVRREFYQKLLDKSLAEVNAYWARLLFSGRTQPPLALDSARDVLEKVAQNPNVIGYIDSGSLNEPLNERVKIVYKLPE